MQNQIKIKRSANGNVPVLAAGEMAWIDHHATDGGAAGALYIGDMKNGATTVRQIAGAADSSYVTTILDDSALTGDTTMAPGGVGSVAMAGAAATAGAVTVPTMTAVPDGQTGDLRVANTEFVTSAIQLGTAPIHQADDTDIELSGADAATAGDFLVYTGTIGSGLWRNVTLAGDVSSSINGHTMTLNVDQVQNGAVNMSTDTVGAYVSSVVHVANQTSVTLDNSVGDQDLGQHHGVVIGLANDVTIPNDLTVSGDLIVSGTTTTVTSETVSVKDNVFVIGDDSIQNTQDRGIEFKYNKTASAANAKSGWFGFDKTDDTFTYIPDATNTSEEFTGTIGDAKFTNIAGTLTTALQTAITGLGVISAGTWQADKITPAYGGTGINHTVAGKDEGVLSLSGGVFDVTPQMSASLGGTGVSEPADGGILVGKGTGQSDMTVLTIGSVGQKLMVGSNGQPTWSDVMDGGTFT